jgi:hypothetical protein
MVWMKPNMTVAPQKRVRKRGSPNLLRHMRAARPNQSGRDCEEKRDLREHDETGGLQMELDPYARLEKRTFATLAAN